MLEMWRPLVTLRKEVLVQRETILNEIVPRENIKEASTSNLPGGNYVLKKRELAVSVAGRSTTQLIFILGTMKMF